MRITLNNNVEWTGDILKERMRDDEFYYGYCGKHMLSSSEIKLLHKGLKPYWYIKNSKSEPVQALRDGWLFHCSILEPEKYDQQIFVDTLTKGVKFKQAAEVHGYNNVFTRKEREDTSRLQDAFFKNEYAKSKLILAKTEEPAYGIIDGLAFRGKADVITQDGKIVDLKTTTKFKGSNIERKVDNFRRSAYELFYDVQVYIYCNLFDVSYDNFEFLVLDKDTLEIGMFTASKELYDSGKEKVHEATNIYKQVFWNKERDDILDAINNYIIKGTL